MSHGRSGGRRVRRVTSLLAVLALLLAGCGGSRDTPTPGATPAPSPTTATAAAASPTPASAPSPAASGEPIEVEALWYGVDASGPIGGTSSVRVRVQENPGQGLRVGFFESEVGGSGDQWRAAGWMAVITASLLLGKDPSHYEFSFDVAGRIDGPSAGGLMTVAVLAGYLGDTIRPDVTMTGTINPDGTIGPVGGIPHKLEGAAQAGKTLVLVPGGQRYDTDARAGQAVDVVEVGKRLDVEVQLVSDIYAAYRLLTGSELPQLPDGGQRPAFPPRAFDKLRASAITWISRYQQDRSRFTAQPAEVQEYHADTILEADRYAGEADSALTQGQAAVAYQYALYAATLAKVGAQAAEFDTIYLTQGIDPLIERLNAASAAELRMAATLERLKAESPRTATDAVALMDAYSNLAVAQGMIVEAQVVIQDLLDNPEATEDDLLNAIYLASYNYANADIYLDLALDSLSTGTGFGTSPAPDSALLTAMAETLRRGGEANLRYFETLVINPWAEEHGIHPEVAKYYFMNYDSDYLNAVASSAGVTNLAGAMSEPAQVAQLTLGSALAAYSASAALVAKYYSLGAQLDEYASVVGYERSSALADMLDLADRRASDLLRVVAEEEPVPSLYYYEAGRILRQGDPADQLVALNYYWQSAILSQLVGVFAGTVGQE
ncbi:MAG: hypothetical protein QJR03_09210 [Sphaerobacter sp.]|nr:hypothetical protein [Sphaerobacter sp.]